MLCWKWWIPSKKPCESQANNFPQCFCISFHSTCRTTLCFCCCWVVCCVTSGHGQTENVNDRLAGLMLPSRKHMSPLPGDKCVNCSTLSLPNTPWAPIPWCDGSPGASQGDNILFGGSNLPRDSNNLCSGSSYRCSILLRFRFQSLRLPWR